MSTIIKVSTFFLLFFSSLAYSQTLKKEIETEFLKYNELIVKREFRQAMEFVPEQFFEIIPKEQMVLMMEKTFNDPEVEFQLQGPQNIVITENTEVGDRIYCLLSYSSLLRMKFSEKSDISPNESQLRLTRIEVALEETFGKDNVQYNSKTEFFDINAQKRAVAVSDKAKVKWKFLVIEDKQKSFLHRLLPQEIIEKI